MQIGDGTFTNFQDAQYPRINLIQATTDSVNTAYVQLNRDVGPNATNEVAMRAGTPTHRRHELLPAERARVGLSAHP